MLKNDVKKEKKNNRLIVNFTPDHCFEDGYVGKQPVGLEEYCAESLRKHR